MSLAIRGPPTIACPGPGECLSAKAGAVPWASTSDDRIWL
jgi:hypothetical protein